jgi:hypothetical protein
LGAGCPALRSIRDQGFQQFQGDAVLLRAGFRWSAAIRQAIHRKSACSNAFMVVHAGSGRNVILTIDEAQAICEKNSVAPYYLYVATLRAFPYDFPPGFGPRPANSL